MKVLTSAHPDNWLVQLSEKTSAFIGGHQVHLKNADLESILVPKSVYEATTCAMNELRSQNAASQRITDAIKQLPADDNLNFVKYDADGNIITKADLENNGGNCVIKLSDNCDPQIVEDFRIKGITQIEVVDGVPDLSPLAEYSFTHVMVI